MRVYDLQNVILTKSGSLAHALFKIEHCNKMRSDNGHMKWARAHWHWHWHTSNRESTGIRAPEIIRE